MEKKTNSSSQVIEPEILDEQGNVIAPIQQTHKDSAAYRGAGFLTGFVALTFSFIFLLVGALFTVFVVFPLMLLGRILGMQIKTFRR